MRAVRRVLVVTLEISGRMPTHSMKGNGYKFTGRRSQEDRAAPPSIENLDDGSGSNSLLSSKFILSLRCSQPDHNGVFIIHDLTSPPVRGHRS